MLAACVTMEEAKQSWQGASYEEVVRAWGAPARSAKLSDGADVHTWVSGGGPTYRSGPSFGVGIFGGSGGGGMGGGVSVPFGSGQASAAPPCERSLTFRNGKMVEQSWVGPSDACTPFKR